MATALLLAVGLLTGGCGGDGDDDGGVASLDAADGEATQAADDGDNEAELLAWVECMRDEGIPLDDPVRDDDGNVSISGPGIQIGGGPGAASGPPPAAADAEEEDLPPPETMEAARDACGDPPPIIGDERGAVDEEAMQETMLEFAECMRAEGATDFPDPDFSGSGPGGMATERESEERAASGDDGPSERVMIGPFGEIDMSDPTIAAAFEACGDVLGLPDGAGPGEGGAGDGGADAGDDT
jgi:hypothetical protein